MMIEPQRKLSMPQDKPNENWAVIFDVDGTMVDNAKYHEQAWIELGRRHNLPITGQYYREHIHSRSNDKNIRKLFNGNATEEMVHKFSSEKEAIYRETFRPVIKEIPGLTDLLKALKKRSIRCAAASNSPQANVDMVIDELNIREYFDVIIDYTQVTNGKPDPEILHTAADNLAVPYEKCVVVEDSISGFKAAERAGMPYIVITAGADTEELKHAKTPGAIHNDFTTITPTKLQELVI